MLPGPALLFPATFVLPTGAASSSLRAIYPVLSSPSESSSRQVSTVLLRTSPPLVATRLCSSSESPSLPCLIIVFPCCFHCSFLIHSSPRPSLLLCPLDARFCSLPFLSFAYVKLWRCSWNALPSLLSSGPEIRRWHYQGKGRRRRKVVAHFTGAGASFSGLSTGHPPPHAMTAL